MLVDKVEYIPVTSIEYTDITLDLDVENLTLSECNLFPNIVPLEAYNFLKFLPYSAITNKQHYEFTLMFGQMQVDMRDVAFYFRKTGIVNMSDLGLANTMIGG